MLKSTIQPLMSVFIKEYNSKIILCLCHSKPTASSSTPTEEDRKKELERIAKEASLDEPPTTCCMSGCHNCVYTAWAEALARKMKNADPEIVARIMERVKDPNMKAFLEMELRLRGFYKKK